MCGRFSQSKSSEELADQFIAEYFGDPFIPSFNVAPSTFVPILRKKKGRKFISKVKWGLTPDWMKKDAFGHINARSESLSEKPSFKYLLGENNCIIPADGWFEWIRDGRKKAPYFLKPNTPMYMAGLWTRPSEAHPWESFTIITKEAEENIYHIHNRMPLLIPHDQLENWLEGDIGLIKHQQQTEVSFHRVSDKVNSVKNNSADLIDEVPEPPQQLELF